jgi:hypothetical protein
MCIIDFEVYTVDGVTGSRTFLGETRAYNLILRGQSELAGAWENTGHSVKGFHLAIPTMQVGEMSDFRFSPEYAFGATGAPPNIPGNATMEFRMTLQSCSRYGTGDVGDSEREAWRRRLQADPMMTQSSLRDIEAEEGDGDRNEVRIKPNTAADAAVVSSDMPRSNLAVTSLQEFDIKKMTVAVLKNCLRERSLPVSGRKADLVTRLLKSVSSPVSNKRFDDDKRYDSPVVEAEILTGSAKVSPKQSPHSIEKKKRVVVSSDVAWESVPLPGAKKVRGKESARMLQSEPNAKVDPRTRVEGTESVAVSRSEECFGKGIEKPFTVVRWDESVDTIDVIVDIKDLILRGSQIDVCIASRHISVKMVKSTEDSREVIMAGSLIEPVDTDSSFWWLDEVPEESEDDDSDDGPGKTETRVRLALKKRSKKIWSGVWKEEGALGNAEE